MDFSQAIVTAPAELIAPRAGATVTTGLGTTELSVQAELQAQSQAAAMRAIIEARYSMALKRPRDYQAARRRLLEDCQRPGFAEAAIYSKPVGGQKIEGLSIRFAEAAARALTNIHTSVQVTWDDPDRRVIHVEATDLESNFTISEEAILDKTVERSRADGREVLGERRNSSGKPVYIVKATEDELLTKQSALTSKRRRNCLLGLIPGDLAAEAWALCERTIVQENTLNLPAKRSKMVQAFAGLERPVGSPELAAYLGHAPEQCTPQEITDLGRVYAGIRDGETTWAEVMAARGSNGAAPGLPTAPAPEPEASGPVAPSTGSAPAVLPRPATPPAPAGAESIIPSSAGGEAQSALEQPQPPAQEGTLEAEMRAAKDIRALNRLAVRINLEPAEKRDSLKNIYNVLAAQLRAK